MWGAAHPTHAAWAAQSQGRVLQVGVSRGISGGGGGLSLEDQEFNNNIEAIHNNKQQGPSSWTRATCA